MAPALLLALASVGIAVGFGLTGSSPATAASRATVDGVELVLDTAGWVRLDHDPTSMPMAMMPGAPAEGSGRVAVYATLTNPSGSARRVEPAELSLVGGDGRTWFPGATTLGEAVVLRPGQQLGLSMWFDVELPADDLYLLWTRDGDAARFPVVGSDEPSVHH